MNKPVPSRVAGGGCVWLLALAAGGCFAQQDQPSSQLPIAAESSGRYQDEARHREARNRMIDRQLKIAGREIKNPQVLKAMKEVPRHFFVAPSLQDHAYDDSPLPIGFGQTISQPYIVAFMTEILRPKPTDRVLEVGTGSGYQAAVLAALVKDVYSVEIVQPLADRAKQTFEDLKIVNVHVKAGDGYQGWPEHAPFDAVIVTCAPEKIPQALCDQLAEGGRMIIPVGKALGSQELILLEKQQGKLKQRSVLPVRFVPMTGGDE